MVAVRSALVASALCFDAVSGFVAGKAPRAPAPTRRFAGEVSVELSKPLGLVLEEVVPNEAKGVYVKDILPEGSAAKSSDVEVNMRIVSAGGVPCTALDFDGVMSVLAEASAPVKLVLKPEGAAEDEGYCLLKVVDPKGEISFVTAQQGANLRASLLNGGAGVYDFMGTMTNCNGAGQCGTCVVAVQDTGEGAFDPRSDYEAKKLKDRPESHRLSCQTVVKGTAATVNLRPPKK